MSNFKFKAANGSDVSLNEITHPFTPGVGTGYAPSHMNYWYPSLIFNSDGTPGQAGITTCNNSYNINDQDILNDGYKSIEFPPGKGALGAYRFFTQSENNVDIPPWCHYLRILLIAGGGGGHATSGYGGGAGQLTLVELPVGTMTKYIITVGPGGAITSPGGPVTSGDGHLTSFNTAAGTPFPYKSAYFDAGPGGGGQPGWPGAGGGSNNIIYPDVSNDDPLQVYAEGAAAQLNKGGYGAGPTIQGWDIHFGFYVGRMEEQTALVKEMVNLPNKSHTYGRGGDANSPGMPGCACVFYFPHQPPPLIIP